MTSYSQSTRNQACQCSYKRVSLYGHTNLCVFNNHFGSPSGLLPTFTDFQSLTDACQREKLLTY